MNKLIKDTKKILKKEFSEDVAFRIIEDSKIRFNKLKDENRNDSKIIKKQTEKKIYPAISLYKTMLKHNVNENHALRILDNVIEAEANKKAKSLKILFKIPGLYKLYPKMFKKVTDKNFSEEAGFKPEFIEASKTRCKFNMTHCLYKDVLTKYHSQALLKSFCHTDDICNEGLHKNLIWNRQSAMGFGSKVCDFDISIKK